MSAEIIIDKNPFVPVKPNLVHNELARLEVASYPRNFLEHPDFIATAQERLDLLEGFKAMYASDIQDVYDNVLVHGPLYIPQTLQYTDSQTDDSNYSAQTLRIKARKASYYDKKLLEILPKVEAIRESIDTTSYNSGEVNQFVERTTSCDYELGTFIDSTTAVIGGWMATRELRWGSQVKNADQQCSVFSPDRQSDIGIRISHEGEVDVAIRERDYTVRLSENMEQVDHMFIVLIEKFDPELASQIGDMNREDVLAYFKDVYFSNVLLNTDSGNENE